MDALPAGTILCVDDDSDHRRSLAVLLQFHGFLVWEAGTGAEGLQLARQGPDLILLDVRLPDQSGFEVCRQIKSDPTTATVPVIQLSGHFVRGEDRVQGLEGGADAYLTKPSDPRTARPRSQPDPRSPGGAGRPPGRPAMADHL